MIALGMPEPTRYMRTSWMLTAESVLTVPEVGAVRFVTAEEVERLSETISKRNVFARHSRENHFYLGRVSELADKTVLEMYLPGNPVEIREHASTQADLLERIAILSSTLYMRREELHRRLGLRTKPRAQYEFSIGPNYRYLTSRSLSEPEVRGVTVDQRFCRRFSRLGFSTLTGFLSRGTEFAKRTDLSTRWLAASRLETDLNAAVVKTAIALESLLVFSESEPLARSLSERVAFILSPMPDTRVGLSKLLKDFYDVRSGIVHGSAKKRKKLSNKLLECVDRLCLLMYLTIAANPKILASEEALPEWCNLQKWGFSSGEIVIPFTSNYLTNALHLAEGK